MIVRLILIDRKGFHHLMKFTNENTKAFDQVESNGSH
jgi:hypothetical protein